MTPALFVEIAVTLSVAGIYTYRVPASIELARVGRGARVLVPFARQGRRTGVVIRSGVSPPARKISDISEALDPPNEPALSDELLDLCAWIAQYYEANLGEVIRAALPPGTEVSERPVVALTEAGRGAIAGEGSAMPHKLRDALSRFASGPVPTAGMSPAVRRTVVELVAAGLVAERDLRAEARAKPRMERIAMLSPGLDVNATIDTLTRAPKRREILHTLSTAGELEVSALGRQVKGATGALRELEKAGHVLIVEREAASLAVPVAEALGGPATAPPLTAEQTVAVDAIVAGLAPTTEKLRPFLLHGVTGSGKTEVYLRVIAETLAAGKTALVLVPEISLTPQLAARFRARFGDQVAILHSGLSVGARFSEWTRLRRGEATIAVGARSAIFAPLANIGAIIIDEEHDPSYKQEEGVRYHARDVALVRAQRNGAICVLGSATPSLESYAHAERGNYEKLVLTQRPTARSDLPRVEVVDLKTYLADGEANISAPLRAAIGETLAAGDQVILFLNRRGFSTFVFCRACGNAFRCPRCSVAMTYHRFSDRLSCHYCGGIDRVPEQCPKCETIGSIERKGLGTEQVADAVAKEWPQARVLRLDRDVASGARTEQILSRVARREVDILVGTQMVTKGHDFPGVTLVGVLLADTGLTLPDFRASERTYQLLAQVAGRAGRGERAGRVIVQTFRPDLHPITAAAAHDYRAFYDAEMVERSSLGYPPVGRMMCVRVHGTQAQAVVTTAERMAHVGKALAARPENAGVLVNDAAAAPLAKLRDQTRWLVWLRSEDRHALRRVARGMVATEVEASVRVSLDVDPLSAL
jgi:primosomal protein N' (replication factor Y)